MPPESRSLGHVAFDAYSAAVGGRSAMGTPIPPWQAMPATMRAAWSDAASAAVRAFLGHPAPDALPAAAGPPAATWEQTRHYAETDPGINPPPDGAR